MPPAAAGSKRSRQAQPVTQSKKKQTPGSASRGLKRTLSNVEGASGDERDESSLDAQLFKQFAQRVRGKPSAKEQQSLQQQQDRLQQQLQHASAEKAVHLKETLLEKATATANAEIQELEALLEGGQSVHGQNLGLELFEEALATAEMTKQSIQSDADKIADILGTTQAALANHKAQQQMTKLEASRVMTALAHQAQARATHEADTVGMLRQGQSSRRYKKRHSLGDLLQQACQVMQAGR